MGLEEQIKQYVNDAVNVAIQSALAERTLPESVPSDEENIIRGLSGLAKYLNVSVPTAQKLKKAQVFPSYQWGRILIFKKNEVLTGMASKKKSKL